MTLFDAFETLALAGFFGDAFCFALALRDLGLEALCLGVPFDLQDLLLLGFCFRRVALDEDINQFGGGLDELALATPRLARGLDELDALGGEVGLGRGHLPAPGVDLRLVVRDDDGLLGVDAVRFSLRY
jgi:hypothetical protein